MGPQPDELGRAARDGQPGVAAAAGDLCPWHPRGADAAPPEVYLHAVATATGLRLDEHLNELHERPPLAQIMPAEQDQDTVA